MLLSAVVSLCCTYVLVVSIELAHLILRTTEECEVIGLNCG
jgi:hypothetical protein